MNYLGTYFQRAWLKVLNATSGTVTIDDWYNLGPRSALGDTLQLATFVSNLSIRYPRLKIRVRSKNLFLLERHPVISGSSSKEPRLPGFFRFAYPFPPNNFKDHLLRELYDRLDVPFNLIRVPLVSPEEIKRIAPSLPKSSRRRIAINTASVRSAKNWYSHRWQELIARLSPDYDILHLGDGSEAIYDNTYRFAGELTPMESLAALSLSDCFIGPDSFLMHGAFHLNVPAVIILGGRLRPENIAYTGHSVLYDNTECSPCGLQSTCSENNRCFEKITVERVIEAVRHLMGKA